MYIREYFQFGTLPPRNTICVPPSSPFSLNSTDPDSPFYDLELAHSVVPINDVLFVEGSEEGGNMMDAAKGVQRWAAQNEFFGKLHKNQRVDALLASLYRDHIAV